MNKLRTILATALAVALLSGSIALGRSATPPPGGSRIYDMKWLNINKWSCPFYNDGRYGIDVTVGSGVAGGSWPQPYKNMYIFGAGLWFGSLKARNDGSGKTDTLVTFGYNPNSGGTEMTPVSVGQAAGGAGSPNDRVFVYPNDWPPRPRDYFVYTPELDSLVPTDNFSLQDMWCVYSDAAPENHISPGKPQNIEIYQTIYAWNYPSNQDIFFILYYVRNAGDDTLKRCFMGAVNDPDIGNAPDDMVGLLLNDSVPGAGLVQDVGYAGDVDNQENPGSTWEQGTPGVFAYKFLDSPRRNGVKLGMTAFKKFTIDIDPVTDPYQYMTMAGFDYRTGVFSPYDSVDLVAADKRFIQCSGPFDLAPGQVERLVVAAMCAPFGGANQQWADRPRDSLVHLARVANAAQYIYDNDWLLPGPPVSPKMQLVPGDNQVRIVWDNLSEVEPDKYWLKVARDTLSPGYDPNYRGDDFQGYILYKSRDGSNWGVLAQYDKQDSIVFIYPPGGDSAQPDTLWIKATDNGLQYSFLDTKVSNGYNYYYCITAYDFNFVTNVSGNDTTIDTLILRSGIVSNFSTVPRWNEANYSPPACSIKAIAGVPGQNGWGLTCSSQVVVPYDVTETTYVVQFLGPTWNGITARQQHSYFVRKLGEDSLIVDTTTFHYTVANPAKAATFYAPGFNGQQLKLVLKVGVPATPFDAIATTGSYPSESLKVGSAPTQALWAWRGSDYVVVWQNSGGYLTAQVYDVSNGGIEVPYAPFTTSGNGPRQANGWCFVDRAFRNPSDTLKGTMASLYVGGGYLGFRQSGDSIRGLTGLIQPGDTWKLTGSRALGNAPFYHTYHVTAVPGKARLDTNLTLNVKVVPNPYIVYDAWEKNTEQRVVRFTHLPSEYTIRIYTTSGDLVKEIRHTDQNQPPTLRDRGGTAFWDFVNDSGQLIASGLYVYHVESPNGMCTGKLVFIH